MQFPENSHERAHRDMPINHNIVNIIQTPSKIYLAFTCVGLVHEILIDLYKYIYIHTEDQS